MNRITPEQELFDNLYELQSARERAGIGSDIAILDDKIYPGSSFFIDYKTCTREVSEFGLQEKVVLDGTRIVLSALPKYKNKAEDETEDEFLGAILRISNKNGIELPNGTLSVDTLFFIGKTLAVQCLDKTPTKINSPNELLDFDTQRLADMLNVPQSILPLPICEEDSRQIPDDLESLYWPRDGAFSLGANIFDQELENNTSLIADKIGVIKKGETEYNPLFYRVQVSESIEDLEERFSEFDRTIKVIVQFSDEIELEIIAPGTSEIAFLKQNNFLIKLVRQGMMIYGLDDKNNKRFYAPTKKTIKLIDKVLSNVDILSKK